MQLKLISHASFLIECGDLTIWTDPWLLGKAFNDSWSLLPPAEFNPDSLDRIDYLWISHEHPDHFHVPTLKSLPEAFKQHVTVLFQENNSDKVFDALRKFGFKNFQLLPHRKIVALSNQTEVYCSQIGNMDSCLGVRHGGQTVLNLNDCEANRTDCKVLRKDLGPIDVVLNQFSIAGYSGEADRAKHLTANADSILSNVSENHRDLKAKVTIPMASFIYFSSEDNQYVNEYANKPQDVVDRMTREGQQCAVLYCGDSYHVGQPHDSAPALDRFRKLYSTMDQQPIDRSPVVELSVIQQSFDAKQKHFRQSYPSVVLRWLKPVVVRIPDLDKTIEFSLNEGWLREISAETAPDVTIHSQPLDFVFHWPFGLQTLGVSARFTLHKNGKNWRMHRVLCSLDSAELYLKPHLLLSRRNLSWAIARLPGAWNQLRYKMRRMRPKAA